MLLVAAQRTNGVEVGVNGSVTARWQTTTAYAYRDGRITRTVSAAAAAGAVLAQVPAHTFSLWNRYDIQRNNNITPGSPRAVRLSPPRASECEGQQNAVSRNVRIRVGSGLEPCTIR